MVYGYNSNDGKIYIIFGYKKYVQYFVSCVQSLML